MRGCLGAGACRVDLGRARTGLFSRRAQEGLLCAGAGRVASGGRTQRCFGASASRAALVRLAGLGSVELAGLGSVRLAGLASIRHAGLLRFGSSAWLGFPRLNRCAL